MKGDPFPEYFFFPFAMARLSLSAADLSESLIADLSIYEPSPGASSTSSLSSFSEGDVVEYGDGNLGVVTAKMTEEFEWPGGDGDETVAATTDEPIYIVARETGGAKPFDATELSPHEGGFDEDVDPTKLADEAEMADIYYRMDDPGDGEHFAVAYEELANVPGVDDPEVGFSTLPDGWTRKSVLQAWASLGGTWTSCNGRMTSKKGPRFAKRWCSALKDEVLGTENWRGKF